MIANTCGKIVSSQLCQKIVFYKHRPPFHQFVGKTTQNKEGEKGEKNTTPMLPTPAWVTAVLLHFRVGHNIEASTFGHLHSLFFGSGASICVLENASNFSWGGVVNMHMQSSPSVVFVSKQFKSHWIHHTRLWCLKSNCYYTTIQEINYFLPRFRHVSQKWSVHGYDIPSFFPFFFICMSGDTLWLFIYKVVVCGTLVVKYEVTSFMTIECNMKMTLRGGGNRCHS
jgi:hypothetical protein